MGVCSSMDGWMDRWMVVSLPGKLNYQMYCLTLNTALCPSRFSLSIVFSAVDQSGCVNHYIYATCNLEHSSVTFELLTGVWCQRKMVLVGTWSIQMKQVLYLRSYWGPRRSDGSVNCDGRLGYILKVYFSLPNKFELLVGLVSMCLIVWLLMFLKQLICLLVFPDLLLLTSDGRTK